MRGASVHAGLVILSHPLEEHYLKRHPSRLSYFKLVLTTNRGRRRNLQIPLCAQKSLNAPAMVKEIAFSGNYVDYANL